MNFDWMKSLGRTLFPDPWASMQISPDWEDRIKKLIQGTDMESVSGYVRRSVALMEICLTHVRGTDAHVCIVENGEIVQVIRGFYPADDERPSPVIVPQAPTPSLDGSPPKLRIVKSTVRPPSEE